MAPKKPSKNKPGPFDDIVRGVNKFNRGMKTVNKVIYEVSGAGDVERFAKKPSAKNAAMLGVTIASYAGGPALKARAAGKAGKAALAAEKKVLGTQAASLARAIPEKSMKFTRPGGAKSMNIPKGNLVQSSGKKIPVSGFEKATTAKNVNRVTSGRIAAVNAKADKAGKVAAKDTMKAAAPKIKAANTAGVALAGSKAGTTYSTQKNKPKKK
jgi:hypothetical protein